MKERPILFSALMVRAILGGRKTQTRRVVKPIPKTVTDESIVTWDGDAASLMRLFDQVGRSCPYGQPGDRLWVREAFMHEPADYCWEASVTIPVRPANTIYRADSDPNGEANGIGWKPSIHMPRWASRILLEITAVRVERLQDISVADAMAEGVIEVAPHLRGLGPCMEWRYAYEDLWRSINGAGSWDENPWVWCISFRRIDAC